jgi:hypothetical protein
MKATKISKIDFHFSYLLKKRNINNRIKLYMFSNRKIEVLYLEFLNLLFMFKILKLKYFYFDLNINLINTDKYLLKREIIILLLV